MELEEWCRRVEARVNYSFYGQQDFSDVGTAFHETMRLGGLVKRESAVNVRSDSFIFEHWPNDAFNVIGYLGFFIQTLGS